MLNDLEVWLPCPHGRGLYEVSSLGRVRSWNNNRWGRRQTPKDLQAHTDKDGYQVVNLGRGVVKRIHALVCEAFHGQPPAGMQCCHGDDDPANNRADNLRWGTPVSNMEDLRANGGLPRGSSRSSAKLTETDIVVIRRLRAAGKTLHELAGIYTVADSTIGDVVRGEKWTHVQEGLNG